MDDKIRNLVKKIRNIDATTTVKDGEKQSLLKQECCEYVKREKLMGLSIGDVEKITGISKDRLRYYEEKKLIIPNRNEENSYRTYNWEEIVKLFGIQLYRAMDMGVKDIQLIHNAESLEGMLDVFKQRQEQLMMQLSELQQQNAYVERCIEDCKKIERYLNQISICMVNEFYLTNRLEDSLKVEEYEKFKDEAQEQKIVIRSFIRRIEFTKDGIGENAVFVLEEDESKQMECVYTIVKESEEYNPMMETYVKCMRWIEDNKLQVGRYCYVRPLLISHLGKYTESYMEVFVPIIKNST